MLSNQNVNQDLNSITGLWMGETIAEQLKNPRSQLYKDLQNARENAARRKREGRKIAEQQHVIAKQQKRQAESLQDELNQRRETVLKQSREDFDRYNQEQHALAMKQEDTLASSSNNVFEKALLSLDVYTQQLIAIELTWKTLENQRIAMSQNYANSQQAYANQLTAILNSDKTYLVNGKLVSLKDISKLPAHKQHELHNVYAEVVANVANIKATADIKRALPKDHPMQDLDLEKRSLRRVLSHEVIISKFSRAVLAALFAGQSNSRMAADFTEQLMSELLDFEAEARLLDAQLSQIDKEISVAQVQQFLLKRNLVNSFTILLLQYETSGNAVGQEQIKTLLSNSNLNCTLDGVANEMPRLSGMRAG